MASDNIDEQLKNLRIAAMKGNWIEVLRMYDDRKTELRTEMIAPTQGTVLHMAVSRGALYVVRRMVRILEGGESAAERESGDEKERVLKAENEKGNTPLHLAASASKWSFEMCKILGKGKENTSLITITNKNGETPLFMAALHGNKEAFLWLYYNSCDQGSSTHYRNHDNDTILHCAIAGGHIDLAIEIVHLYKNGLNEMTMRPNKNGLRPLHLLAATPSAFESSDLAGRAFLVRFLYHWFFRVKKKEQATTMEELETEHESFFENLIKHWSRPVFMKFFGFLRVKEKKQATTIEGSEPHERELDTHNHWSRFMLMKFFHNLVRWILAHRLSILFEDFLDNLLLEVENWFRGIRKLKEKHTWSLQIMERLLQLASGEEDVTANPYIVASEAPGAQIVDTPLMIAAQNGVIEMVVKILTMETNPKMKDVNEEGKNIVLLAVEKRQTNLYRFLCGYLDSDAFRQVDNDGNTALHLAAMFGLNLNMQRTTMIEEFKWFELVKSSVPSELREKYNNDGKTAEEIFRESYKELNTSDRQWLNQTSQTCPVASTVVASMAFSNFAGENIDKKNYPSLVALSLSLTSTICFLAMLSFRTHSPNVWKYVPFMLHFAILTMIGSIVALWISLMVHGKSLTTYVILGAPIAILAIVSLPIFIGRTLMSTFAKVPPPNRRTTSAIRYRRPQKKKDEKAQTILCKILEALEDVQGLKGGTLN